MGNSSIGGWVMAGPAGSRGAAAVAGSSAVANTLRVPSAATSSPAVGVASADRMLPVTVCAGAAAGAAAEGAGFAGLECDRCAIARGVICRGQFVRLVGVVRDPKTSSAAGEGEGEEGEGGECETGAHGEFLLMQRHWCLAGRTRNKSGRLRVITL